MKKSSKHYKKSQTSVPMLVSRLVNQNVESIEEHSMLLAFKCGVATKQNFNYLVRMANMLNVASKKRLYLKSFNINNINILCKKILENFIKTDKFCISHSELILMCDIVNFYDNFWKRQTTTFYNECIYEVNAFYNDLKTESTS